MSNLSIQQTQINYQSLTQLGNNKELLAHSVAKENGADDILFKTDSGTFAVSGHHLPVDKLEVGTRFDFQGQAAEVIFVDNQNNSLSDGWKSVKKNTPYALAGAVAVGVIGGGLTLLSGSSLPRALTVAAQLTVAQTAISGAVGVGVMAHAALRGSEQESLKALAK